MRGAPVVCIRELDGGDCFLELRRREGEQTSVFERVLIPQCSGPVEGRAYRRSNRGFKLRVRGRIGASAVTPSEEKSKSNQVHARNAVVHRPELFFLYVYATIHHLFIPGVEPPGCNDLRPPAYPLDRALDAEPARPPMS